MSGLPPGFTPTPQGGCGRTMAGVPRRLLAFLLTGACGLLPPGPAVAAEPPLTASAAAERAVRASGAVRALERAVEAARARARAAGAWPNPAVVSQYQLSTDPGNHMLTVGVRQPLDFRGLARQRQEAAEDGALAIAAELTATRRQVAYQARRAYVSLWLALATVRGHEADQRYLRDELARGKRRVAAGALAAHELIHTEFELALAHQRWVQAGHDAERARDRLNVLFGSPVATPIPMPPVALAAPAPEGDLATWVAEARRQRAEPLQAELGARQERRSARLAESLRFGEGELDLEGGTAGPYGAPMLYSAFSLPVPLWNDHAAEAAAHEAEAARQEAQRAAAEATIAAEVTDAWLETRQAAARVEEVARGPLALAGHALEKARARLAAGAGSPVEVLEARQQQREAETSHLQALLAYHLARLRLEEAAGR
ncbi:MAG: TolC family protein [Candidatus Sericytochromatia bacterium]|nr:TolC family protein [Candidatus Sericytochromatia bacterium]